MSCVAKRACAVLAAASWVLLASCSSAEESGYCAGSFAGGATSSATACAGCTVETEGDAIDDSSGSSARLNFPTGGGEALLRAIAPGDDAFPSGTNPGALMQFPVVNLVNSGVSFTLYNNGAMVSSASGGASAGQGPVPGSGSKHYYDDVSTPLEFDAVEAQVTISGNTEPLTVLVYEICGDN